MAGACTWRAATESGAAGPSRHGRPVRVSPSDRAPV